MNVTCEGVAAEEDLGASWTAAMRAAQFDRAWRVSDEVLCRRIAAGEECWHRPRHLQYVWRGQPLENKRVLVRCYHGLGDTIQFVRFMAPLREIAREVALWVQPQLLPLTASVSGVDQAIALHDGDPGVDYDVDIEIMEVAHALRITAEALSRDVPYLRPPDLTLPPAAPSSATAEALRVGIVWQAGGWNPGRSVPAATLKRLVEIPGITLLSLQQGSGRAEAALFGAADYSTPSIPHLAARMMALDLIISVDSMAAHLAGALGRPVWTLLQAQSDWRWMEARNETPWYPTMRLFRQHADGDWSAVVEEIAHALRAHVLPTALPRHPTPAWCSTQMA
jgi:Glycosyltransferase family 9 (heptosyltransferase)